MVKIFSAKHLFYNQNDIDPRVSRSAQTVEEWGLHFLAK